MSPTVFKVARTYAAPDTLTPVDDWRVRGLCSTDIDDELWFPERGDKDTARRAVTACFACPVLLRCRQAAADEERGWGLAARYGIRGGLTPKQRWQADTDKPSDRGGRRTARCGTSAAYDRHIRRGEDVDDPCRRAHAERNVQVRAEQRQRRAAATECGTRGGYQKHRRNGEQACDPCRQANADADRNLRNTGTTTERSAA